MALKFLNKKGWHTGSLRNIENVWKAEQKHDAEQKKLEELRKQIHEERERSEFRQIQEEAGLVPRQERLDFLYESGLAVRKGSSEGFKALQDLPSGGPPSVAAESSSSKAVVPGALFEEKPQSANDAWRKLHTDPLLLIRQKEQEALARIKNNPIRMAMIRKSVESKKREEDKKEHKNKRNKHKHDRKKSLKDEDPSNSQSDLERGSAYEGNGDDKKDRRNDKNRDRRKGKHNEEQKHSSARQSKYSSGYDERRDSDLKPDRRKHSEEHSNYSSRDRSGDKHAGPCEQKERRNGENRSRSGEKYSSEALHPQSERLSSGYNRRQGVPKMSEEEREARLREMQMDAEFHEDQRWKRLKKAAETDALEASQATYSRGKSFLDATQKSVYGMEKGGSATIEESVRRRAYYSQGQSEHDRNAFRR